MPFAAHRRPCLIQGNGDSILALEFSPNFLLVRSQFRQIHKLVFSVCWDQSQAWGSTFAQNLRPPPKRNSHDSLPCLRHCLFFECLGFFNVLCDFEPFRRFFFSGAAPTLNRTHEKWSPNNTCFENTIKFVELL